MKTNYDEFTSKLKILEFIYSWESEDSRFIDVNLKTFRQ